ncbi:glycine-rich domain-containing protein [Falsirhodobacter halotolerans]|uniref:glycine-rich domain-containing protein n=1 Tax=Falsirhodobacter halotolerans TaxID=1146892 RepID=UPI001FD391F3|nr:hypothetical protein [Falsirhodobacter halotolerans]MCJ8138618.1 hypothetical protein [Falsirhodobacter halotolerans]
MFDESTGVWSTVRIDGVAYRLGILTASATLVKTAAGAFDAVLIGAGGTGGDATEGGGGGAGYVLQLAGRTLPAGSYPITIGAAPTAAMQKGGDTSAFGLLAPGGGLGTRGGAENSIGGDGGNGGGAGASGTNGQSTVYPGGKGNPGFDGGRRAIGGTGTRGGGGGGGNGGPGGDASPGNPGTGGPPIVLTFTGVSVAYAPGGSGGRSGAAPVRPEGVGTWGTGGATNGAWAAQPGAVMVRYALPVTPITGGGTLPAMTAAGRATVISPVAGGGDLPALTGGGTLVPIAAITGGADLPALTGGGSLTPLYLARGRIATAEHSRSWTRDPGRRFT